MINSFRENYYFLSNFYEAPVEWEGIKYLNNEAAFQSAKVFGNERLKFANLNASEAKKLGRTVNLRKDWENVKIDIMKDIVRCKFIQNEDLAEKLLATGNEYLEEGNTWGDKIWGTVNGSGANNLGKILMEVREELRELQNSKEDIE